MYLWSSQRKQHFLMDCPLHNNARNKLFADLNRLGFDPSLNNLLYGDKSLRDKINIDAFKAIQTFLKDSQRF